jgi:membrane protease YdiL (CAAX protease family)
VFDWRLASLVSSMIYAIVHFLAPVKSPAEVHWYSGFGQLGLMLGGFTDWQQVIPGFFNLTLVGIILALAYQRTGNLYCSIGLHAAWIFWVKFYGIATKVSPDANAWLWGSGRMAVVNGWAALPVLAGTLLILTRVTLNGNRPTRP